MCNKSHLTYGAILLKIGGCKETNVANINAITTSAAVLGQILVKLRTERGLKQSDLATAVGIGPSTWSRIEKGESGLSIDQLKLAARALSVTPGQILDMAELAEKEVASRGVLINGSTAPAATIAAAIQSGALGAAVGSVAGAVIPVIGVALGGLMGGVIDKLIREAVKKDN